MKRKRFNDMLDIIVLVIVGVCMFQGNYERAILGMTFMIYGELVSKDD